MAEQITTAEELDALPVGSVVNTKIVAARKVDRGGLVFWACTDGVHRGEIRLLDIPPVTVVYRPDVDQAAHDRQVAARAWDEGFEHAHQQHYAEDLRLSRRTPAISADNPYRADTLAPSAGAPGVAADEREAVLRDAYNDITGDGWGPERTEEVLVRVYDAALAARPAPEVSVNAEQVEALAAYLWPRAMADGDETVRASRIGTARDAVTITLGITVTDEGGACGECGGDEGRHKMSCSLRTPAVSDDR